MSIQWQGVAVRDGVPNRMHAEIDGYNLEAHANGMWAIRQGREAIAMGRTRNLDEAIDDATREFATIHTNKEPKR